MLCVQQKASISSSAKTRINTLIVPRLSRVAITRTGAGISRTSRFSLLTVFAGQGRGEEVVAFLPEDGSNRTTTTTAPKIKIYTMDGRQYSLPLTVGITPVGDIRAFVSQKENVPVDKVRLAYAGRELDPTMDFQVFVPQPGIGVMHVMHRMSGGGQAVRA